MTVSPLTLDAQQLRGLLTRLGALAVGRGVAYHHAGCQTTPLILRAAFRGDG
jgi:hypothetical protein